MKKIKTVADVFATPENEWINTRNYAGCCSFCGKKLKVKSYMGLEYYPCDCELGQAAAKHNERANEIEKKRLEDEEKALNAIKTVADVEAFPKDKFIGTYIVGKNTCRFCGHPLSMSRIDDCSWQLGKCSCAVAKAAEVHNATVEVLRKEAAEKKHAELLRQLAKEREEELAKPVTIALGQMFSVVSGCILPGIEPVDAEDTVALAMRHAGFSDGSARKCLIAYAQQQGFADGLNKAADELVSWVRQSQATWRTDITPKVTELRGKYNLPDTLTL